MTITSQQVARDQLPGGNNDSFNGSPVSPAGEEADGEVSKLKEYIAQLEIEKAEAHKKLQEYEKKLHSLKTYELIKSSELYFLQKRLEEGQHKRFTIDDIADHISHYTGLPNMEMFNVLFSMFEDEEITYHQGWTARCISKKDQFLQTLMKLKRNFSNIDLSKEI